MLLKAPTNDAAEAMEVLLEEDEALAVSLLAHTRRSRTRELIKAMTSPKAWVEDLPTAADAIERCHGGQRDLLGENVGPLTHASDSKRGRRGYSQTFENGQIYWSAPKRDDESCPGDGKRDPGIVQATTGPMSACLAAGGSVLGFPLTPVMDARSSFETDGKLQRFEFQRDYGPELCKRIGLTFGATVYWSDKHGAHITWGGIGEHYERLDGPGSWLGFPVSAEMKAGPSRRDTGPGTSGWCQRFEGGAIYYIRKGVKGFAVAVPAHVASYLESHGGVTGRRGFPVSPELDAADSPYGTTGRMQRFEGAWDYPKDILEHWSDQERPGGATVYTSEAYGTFCVGWGMVRPGSTTEFIMTGQGDGG